MKLQASLSIRLEARGGSADAGHLTLRERLQRERREQRRPSWQDLLVEGELGRVQPRDIFPDAEPDKGPRHLLQEVREILGAHRRVGQLQNRVPAEELLCHAQGTAGRAFIVGGDRVRENIVKIHVAAHPVRHAAGYGFHTPRHPLAKIRVQSPYRSPEAGLLRDDVEGRSSPDLPHGEDGWLDRVYLPRDDGLQYSNHLCRDDYGVGGQMGHRAVPARAYDLHLESVGGGHNGTCLRGHLSERQPRPQVQREDGGDIVCHPFIYHDSSTSSAFLRRLEHELDGAVQAVAQVFSREGVGRADEHARVPIVATSVHPASYPRGEWQARFLLYGEGVHVCPQRYRRSFSSPERGDDPVPRDARLYVEG